MTRRIKDIYFDGAGEHSVKEAKLLHEILDKGLSTLSGMQQPGHPDSEKAAKEEEKFFKQMEEELDDIVEDLVCALKGPKKKKKVKQAMDRSPREPGTMGILNDIESFINGRIELDIGDEMKSAYKDVRFLVRQHIKSVKKATEKTCPYCGSHKIIVFDSNNDLCQKCNRYFPGT